ncbi:hypothetical protein KC340_g3815 [Hortaea werneckii]|nr:hypothetical protein KC342_g4072 [Hortaea werneckii]KAI7102339.1 hypothetical protein KC339_g6063 [Hortaea werneckii]KAI7240228.1 hypothetical protein KC365_g3908 [Hortaea werneckii]KAI7331513.1 hypothetical protein KC340_g3815 [Hortaea werneckii]KAI7401307.1 hypothetical protein KC328_g3236 [Hortaea werneckii]
MFECNACTLRYLRALASEAAVQNRHHSRLLLTPHLTIPSHRRAASTAAAPPASNQGNPYLNAAQLRHQTQGDVIPFDHDRPATEVTTFDKKALRKELEWLPDPVKFTEHVQYTLRCEKPMKALELVRLASKTRQCTVAWNHVVNYNMQRGHLRDAFAVYNEMKKRAQFPDSYTYVLLLRGLAGSRPGTSKKPRDISPEDVSKAVSLYNSMSAPNSRVKPSIMHTNAVLKVCAFGNDMDAFYGILANLPEVGAGAPDHMTYSIILNAIRRTAGYETLKDLSPRQALMKRRQAVSEARAIWREVVMKWRTGAVRMDEELVSAMARCLLVSEKLKDWDDVLSLIRQTMQIERLVPEVGSPERQIGHVPTDRQLLEAEKAEGGVDVDAEAMKGEDSEASADAAGKTPAKILTDETPDARTFEAVEPTMTTPKKYGPPPSLIHARPGQETLDVLIQTCSKMRMPKTANAYWELLIAEPFNLKPALFNFHSLIRLLLKNRSSGRVAELIQHGLAKAEAQPTFMTFMLAMQACRRNCLNPHALEHAKAIVDVMERTLSDLQIDVLSQYLDIALLSDSGPKIVETLDRLDSCVHNLRSRITFGTDTRKMNAEDNLQDKRDTVEFFQTMIGAIDTLMNRGLVPRKDYIHWHQRRSQLNTFISHAKKYMQATEQKTEGEADEKSGLAQRRGGFTARRQAARADGKYGRSNPLSLFRNPQRRSKQAIARLAAADGEGEGRAREDMAWREKKPEGRRPETRVDACGYADSPADLAM